MAEFSDVDRRYWNIKEGGGASRDLIGKSSVMNSVRGGAFCPTAPQMRHNELGGSPMRKHRIERNLAFPTEEFRTRVRTVAKEQGFRSEQAFILAACENEFKRVDSVEATTQLEARVAASLANASKELQSLFTLAHTQFALTNSLLQYVLTCMVEPPEDILPAARARAKVRYTKILRHAAQEVATRNKATLEEVLNRGKQQ